MKNPRYRFFQALFLLSLWLTATSLWVTVLKTGRFDFSVAAIAVTVFLLLGVFLLVASLSNIIITVFILFHVFSLLSLVSVVKFSKRRIPLIFNDLLLVDELGRFNDVIRIREFIWPAAAALAMTLLALTVVIRWRRGLAAGNRPLCFLLGASLVLGSGAYALSHPQDFEKAGPVYALLASIKLPGDSRLSPEELDFIESVKAPPFEEDPLQKKPNVVLIMSESFWDLDLLPGVILTPDPYETLEAIKKESLYGMLEVPVFAGGTSNTEFEILTSISTHFNPEGYMIFNRDIQGPTASLAGIFRRQGYQSVGLHPFWGWYYNRDEIYADLGFNTFISEEYLNRPRVVGNYISDATAVDHIETLIEDTDEPLFLYTITMQNHGPFDDGRYDEGGLALEVKAEADQVLMQNYAQGMADAIESLDNLLEALENHEEDTLVVFFGDHLPLLGDNMSSFEGNGLFDGRESPEERELKLKTTPLVIWSNYDTPTGDLGILDAIYLGPRTLELANLEMPGHYAYLLDLSYEAPLINPGFTMIQGIFHPEDSEEYQRLHSPLRALYKDLILGDGLVLDESWLVKHNDTFNQSLNDMAIESVRFSDDKVTLHGGPFYEKARLYLNEKETPFEWREDRLLVDSKYFQTGKSITLHLALTNNRGETLARSNDYKID